MNLRYTHTHTESCHDMFSYIKIQLYIVVTIIVPIYLHALFIYIKHYIMVGTYLHYYRQSFNL